MYQLTVGEFKAKFSEVLQKVLKGESVGITYGRNKTKVAALVPYKTVPQGNKIKLGLFKAKFSFKIKKLTPA